MRRPSGPVTAAECAAINGSGTPVPDTGVGSELVRALWGLPLVAAGGGAIAAFLRRRGARTGD